MQVSIDLTLPDNNIEKINICSVVKREMIECWRQDHVPHVHLAWSYTIDKKVVHDQ